MKRFISVAALAAIFVLGLVSTAGARFMYEAVDTITTTTTTTTTTTEETTTTEDTTTIEDSNTGPCVIHNHINGDQEQTGDCSDMDNATIFYDVLCEGGPNDGFTEDNVNDNDIPKWIKNYECKDVVVFWDR